jgi:hypothetical protein
MRMVATNGMQLLKQKTNNRGVLLKYQLFALVLMTIKPDK